MTACTTKGADGRATSVTLDWVQQRAQDLLGYMGEQSGRVRFLQQVLTELGIEVTGGTVKQCKSCPWKQDCVPDKDIPNGYSVQMHKALVKTIRSGLESLCDDARHVMACHYSKPGEEFYCAGWLANQMGPGNNLGVRLAVLQGKMPAPEIDGPQHERFEDTLPKQGRKRRK